MLILFSEQDREVRLEVGYGLEPYITDAIASRIIRNTMIPQFKEEKYFEGISDAADQLISFLKNPEALEEFREEVERSENRNELIGAGFLLLFLSVFVAVGGFYFFKSYKGLIEVLRGIFIGKLGFIPGLFMIFGTSFSSLFGLIFILGPTAIATSFYWPELLPLEVVWEHPKRIFYLLVPFLGIAALIAFFKIKVKGKEDFNFSLLASDSTYFRKTFSSSGSHSFSSSSRSSGSSFSGGGGSSGGGGASGSW